MEGQDGGATAGENQAAAEPAPEQQVDMKDVVNTDFMKDLVGKGIQGLVGSEEEKKDGEGGADGDAAK